MTKIPLRILTVNIWHFLFTYWYFFIYLSLSCCLLIWFCWMQLLADLENNKMFSDDLECQKLLMEAMKYHLLPERRPMFQSPRTKPRKSTVGALYAVGGMDATKGMTCMQDLSLHSNTVYSHCNPCVCCVFGFRLYHHRKIRPADQHLGPGWSHEWTPAAVWRGRDR